jgi:CDGSH-type Zn-finger protein
MELDSGFKPLKFTVTRNTKVHLLCMCKRNSAKAGAYCDGFHRQITDW